MVEKSSFHQLEMMEQHFGGENLSKPTGGKTANGRGILVLSFTGNIARKNGATLLRLGCQL
jgi:hypothetical protein